MPRARCRLTPDEVAEYYVDWCEEREIDPDDRDSEARFDTWVEEGGR
jgi:hypothetical protein